MVLFFWWVWGDPQGSLGVKRTVGPYSEGPTQGNINNLGVENSLGGWVGRGGKLPDKCHHQKKNAYQIQQSLQEFHGWLTKALQSFNKTLVANSAFKHRLQVKQKYTYACLLKTGSVLLILSDDNNKQQPQQNQNTHAQLPCGPTGTSSGDSQDARNLHGSDISRTMTVPPRPAFRAP